MIMNLCLSTLCLSYNYGGWWGILRVKTMDDKLMMHKIVDKKFLVERFGTNK